MTQPTEQQSFVLKFIDVVNFQGINHCRVDFDGESTLLIAGNGKTKSSLLNALALVLGSNTTKVEQPVKLSEDQAEVTLQLAHGEDIYEAHVHFSNKKRAGDLTLRINGELVKSGARTKLNQLIEFNSFDIFRFLSMEPSEQKKQVKYLTGRGEEIDAEEAKCAEAASKLKFLEQQLKNQETANKREVRPFTDEDVITYENPIDIAPIQKAISDLQPAFQEHNRRVQEINDKKNDAQALINKANAMIEKEKGIRKDVDEQTEKIRGYEAEIEAIKLKIQQARDKINHMGNEHDQSVEGRKALKAEYDTIQSQIASLEAAHAAIPAPDATELSKKLADATEHNQKYELIQVYRKRQSEIVKQRKDVEAARDTVAMHKQNIREMFNNSELQIPGLHYNEDGLFLDDLPFVKDQINTAKFIEIGVALSVRMNAKLRLVMIREASLLDTPTFKAIIKNLHEKGYMFIAEIVDQSGGEFRAIKFSESDLVVEANNQEG